MLSYRLSHSITLQCLDAAG